MHKLPRVSILFLHITNDLKALYEKFNIEVKTYKNSHEYRKKLHLRELGSVVAFSVQPELNSWPFYTVCGSLFVKVLFSYIKRSNAGDFV